MVAVLRVRRAVRSPTIPRMARAHGEPVADRHSERPAPPGAAHAESGERVEPALAWNRFTEIASHPLAPYEHSKEDYLALLDSFLTNP